MDNLTSLSAALVFAQNSNYLIIFLLMIFEGPIATAAAAFASSMGILNIYIIIILSLLGNLIPDTILFFIGRYSREKTLEKFIKYFGLTENRIKKFEAGFHKHFGKTMTFMKLVPPFPVPGLLFAGFSKVSIKKFFMVDITFNFISTLIAVFLGFYIGLASSKLFDYFDMGKYFLILIIPIALLIYLIYHKIFKEFGKGLEK